MYHVMCSTGLSALIEFMFDKYSQSVALRLGFSCGGIAHNGAYSLSGVTTR